MKKRLLSLLLVLVLTVGILALPASAATPQQTYDYLVSLAKEGYHNTASGYYTYQEYIDDSTPIIYGVYYFEQDQHVEVTIFTDSGSDDFEVTLQLPKGMSTPYTAYVLYSQIAIGYVQINPASYTETMSLSFSDYQGNTSYKTDMMDTFKLIFPFVLEYTRFFALEDGGYTLADLGFVKDFHSWDSGEITSQATCTENGVISYTCTLCGCPRYVTIPATGHVWTVQGSADGSGNVHEHTTNYVCSNCGSTKSSRVCAGEIFVDMPADNYYSHNPIDWAYFNRITTGMDATHFGCALTCTRGQIVTFLWRASGSPEPTTTRNPFTDVSPSDYFYKAVLWAAEKGITTGTTSTTFSPNDGCTRGQVVTFLWRSEDKPAPSSSSNPFTDVPANEYYYDAVLWAVGNGITNGTTSTTFSPATTCTREQIVTFLYRDLA